MAVLRQGFADRVALLERWTGCLGELISGTPLAALRGGSRWPPVPAMALCGVVALHFVCLGFGGQANAETAGGARVANTPATSQVAPEGFVRYRNARFGYELVHPSTFVAADPPPNGAGQSWVSADGMFELNSFASFNSDGATLQSLRQDLLDNDDRFRGAPVAEVAGYVLWVYSDSGPRTHGYAAIFSCSNQIVNAVEVSYPTDAPDRGRFEQFLTSIIEGFRPGVGEDTPSGCNGDSQQSSAAGDAGPSPGDHPFSDPSLKRLAVYGWSTSGLQNGLWTAGINGENGTILYVRCSIGPGDLRNGSIELRSLRHLPNLAGGQQVNVEIGNYQHGGVFTFSPGDFASNGLLDIVEDDATAGVYLDFLRNLAWGNTLTIEVLDSGYREEFNLYAAHYALGPCIGESIEQPWRNQGERDGVHGTSVRNISGAAFYIRCDATAETRGNTVIAFAAPQSTPTPGIRLGQVETIKAFVGARSQDLRFMLTPEPNVMTGVGYYVARRGDTKKVGEFLAMFSVVDETGDDDDDDEFGALLSLFDSGLELRLLNTDLGVDATFSLSGAHQSVEACRKLYR